ncbi:MAG: Ig-like domain-containing protein [Myxococcota bacterium]
MTLHTLPRWGLMLAMAGLVLTTACGDDDGTTAPPDDMGGDMTTLDMDPGGDMGPDDLGMDMDVDMGPGDMGPGDMGPDDMGPDDMGPDDMGPDDMGSPAAMTSMQIASVRATGSGPIQGATISRVQEELGSFDPAGFFVQAQRGGPALFVETDVAALTPAPAPGDVVSFDVTTTNTDGGLIRAVAISGYMRMATGADVAALAEDISAATDVVTALDDYESELVSFAATVAEEPGGAGDTFEAANIETAGVMGAGRDFRLRGNVLGLLALEVGCTLDVTEVIMWRFNSAAQPQTIDAGEVSGTCPTVPEVASAAAVDAATVNVAFNRPIDPSTFAAGDLAIAAGATTLSIDTVTFDGTGATVTLAAGSELEDATEYTVTVTGVADYLTQAIDTAANTATFTFAAMLTPSQQITRVRDAAPGVLSPGLPVENATVSYVRPQVASDPAGFFVQAEAMGPALFVAVDPATLSPVPEVGDVVSFTADETDVANDQHQVLAISALSRSMTGRDVTPLVQDLSAATDVVTALDDYESELVTITGTTTADDGFAGTGHRSVTFDSAGVSGSPDLLFRFPQELFDAINGESFADDGAGMVTETCTLTVGPAPLWRFRADAQAQALTAGEVSGTCTQGMTVTEAAAPMDMEVRVTFFRAPEDASVQPADFVLEDSGAMAGPAVTAAVVDGRTVTLTLGSALMAGETYTVTVTGVDSLLGEAIDTAANTADFAFTVPLGPPAVGDLVISEYVEGSSNNKAVEIANVGAVDVDLTTCSLRLYRNGSMTVSGTFALTGSLVSNGARAYCNSNFSDAAPDMAASTLCDELTTSTVLTFNGDDALDLVCGPTGAEVTYDVFGRIGEDPGSSWPVPPMGGPAPTVTTANQTLRKDCTAAADTNGADAFDPDTDYADFASDTFGDLGNYVCP